MTMTEFAIAIVGSAIGIFFGALLISPDFRRWLKGHREYYYIGSNGILAKEQRPLRLGPGEIKWRDDAIVVNHMPFLRRTEVYGKGRDLWSVSIRENPGAEPSIFFQDKIGWPIQEFLAIVGKYPLSLQAKLSRIDELEELSRSKDIRIADLSKTLEQMKKTCSSHRCLEADLKAGLWILLDVINRDRQRYRSQAAQRIRVCLEQIYFKFWGGSKPSGLEVTTWRSGPFRDLR